MIQAGGMLNPNGVNTPTTGDPVGADSRGPAFSEKWKYRSTVGMISYLAANTCPDMHMLCIKPQGFHTIPRTVMH